MRKYLLIGYSESGISTTANCLFNKKSSMEFLNGPFQTLNSDTQNSLDCNCMKNLVGDEFIDVKGLLANEDEHNDRIFKSVREKIENSMNSTLDCIIFVCDCKYFMFQGVIFKIVSDAQIKFNQYNKTNHLVLLITNCDKDWTQKDKQKNNCYLQKVLKLCDGKYFELKLDCDQKEDDKERMISNQKQRERQISQFLNKMESFCTVDASTSTTEILMADNLEPSAKRLKTNDSNIKLGHFLYEEQNKNVLNNFDQEFIDLSIWNYHLRLKVLVFTNEFLFIEFLLFKMNKKERRVI